MEKKKIIKIEFPMKVTCFHRSKDPEEEPELVVMNIEVDDAQVPAYMAKCAKCGCEILIDFNP